METFWKIDKPSLDKNWNWYGIDKKGSRAIDIESITKYWYCAPLHYRLEWLCLHLSKAYLIFHHKWSYTLAIHWPYESFDQHFLAKWEILHIVYCFMICRQCICLVLCLCSQYRWEEMTWALRRGRQAGIYANWQQNCHSITPEIRPLDLLLRLAHGSLCNQLLVEWHPPNIFTERCIVMYTLVYRLKGSLTNNPGWDKFHMQAWII